MGNKLPVVRQGKESGCATFLQMFLRMVVASLFGLSSVPFRVFVFDETLYAVIAAVVITTLVGAVVEFKLLPSGKDPGDDTSSSVGVWYLLLWAFFGGIGGIGPFVLLAFFEAVIQALFSLG